MQEAPLSPVKRTVLVLPDFIANAGGVICAAMEYHGSTEREVFSTMAPL